MAALNFVDRFATTLASGYTSGGTSLSVSSASGLPSGACNFYLIIQAEGGNTEEVFNCTNVSGTTLTVTGAQAGTSASNHGAGATVIASIMTVGAFSQYKTDITAAAVAASGWVLVEQHTASSSAELDFTTGITSTYDTYVLVLVNIRPATNGANLILEVSTNGGSTYDSGANYASSLFVYRAGGTGFGGSGDSASNIAFSTTALTAGVNNGASNGVCGDVLFTLLSGVFPQFAGKLTYEDNEGTPHYLGVNLQGAYRSTTAVNAFRLKFDSGNVASGVARLYGVAKS